MAEIKNLWIVSVFEKSSGKPLEWHDLRISDNQLRRMFPNLSIERKGFNAIDISKIERLVSIGLILPFFLKLDENLHEGKIKFYYPQEVR